MSYSAFDTAINTAIIGALGKVRALIGGRSVAGVFDNEYRNALGVADTLPMFSCLTSAVPNVARGSGVLINGTAWTVAEVQPDGTGMTRLMLK